VISSKDTNILEKQNRYRLITRTIARWPKLAWSAILTPGSTDVKFLHGPCMEVTEQWAVEAVWAGDFSEGDFDRTDLIFGSGVRCRGNEVVFVSSGTAMDRLWYCEKECVLYVSNSLAALSACARLSLREDFRYVNDRYSAIRTTWGARKSSRSLPTSSDDVHLIWFHNLIYDGATLREEPKPETAGDFQTFDDYRDFLFEGAHSLRSNLESTARKHKVVPLVSISSGYDSPAAAVVARHAGCREAVTIKQSSSFWRGSDSGRVIAEHLDLNCREYNRTSQTYPHEEAFWAASGYCNLLSWTLIEYPKPVCLFFVGCYGDAIWDRRKIKEPFAIDIWDDLAMGEFRLFVGMLQCVVPFWGMRHINAIQEITFSEEMLPWTMHDDYDRPIARRIVEEAGVPRGAFAVRKKDTSHEMAFRWPYSLKSQASFRQYLSDRSLLAPRPLGVKLLRRLAQIESLIYGNITNKLDIRKRIRPWQKLGGLSLLFHWANQELKQFYQQGLEDCSENQGKR
jgi:hypothetical protein